MNMLLFFLVITGYVTEKIVTTIAPKYAKKKFMVHLSKFQFFRRIFDPFGRINRLRYFHSNLSETREAKEGELNTSLTVYFGRLNVNEKGKVLCLYILNRSI